MGITTSQQLKNYYDIYRDQEVAYTKDILRTLAIDPRQIYVKCNGAQWPCIINSTSFQFAKIIVGTKGGAYASISKKDPPPVSLRFYFNEQQGQPISFFVTGRVTEIQPYMNSTDLTIITITFTQRPPDDLIEKIGSLLEANSNAIRRKEERIIITEDSKRRLQLEKDKTIIYIDNIPRRCIIRDLSFSGAKVILVGIEKFIKGKGAYLCISFEDPAEVINIAAQVVKTEPVENKPEIVNACLQFDEKQVPTSYKIRINNYLTSIRKKVLSAVQQGAATPAQNIAQNQNSTQVQTQNLQNSSNSVSNEAQNNTNSANNSDTTININGKIINTKDLSPEQKAQLQAALLAKKSAAKAPAQQPQPQQEIKEQKTNDDSSDLDINFNITEEN